MDGLRRPTVDVREMLCAQALAVVAESVGRLSPGERVEVVFDAKDVERDLMTWASRQGHRAEASGPSRLLIERTGSRLP